MQNRGLSISLVGRAQEDGPPEEISLSPGINVLTGKANTGKSSWLKFMDYLLGSTKENPDEALGEQLATKYSTAWATVELAGNSYHVERRWKERAGKNRIWLDAVPITPEEFSYFILQQLGVPIINYPRGDPYADRSWATLSWRTLMRHVYRREDQWVSLVPKQPPGEIHACMLEFAGLAEAVYPPALGDLVAKRKLLNHLIARRDNFVQVLGEITEELLGFGIPEGELSMQHLDTMREDISRKRIDLEAERESYTIETSSSNDPTKEVALSDLARRLSEVDSEIFDLTTAIEGAKQRIVEMQDHTGVIRDEAQRLRRAVIAGRTFVDLKITHCPACDEPVRQRHSNGCFLCGNPLMKKQDSGPDARMEFEQAQLKEELQESEGLLSSLKSGLDSLSKSRMKMEQKRLDLRGAYSSISGLHGTLDDPYLREIDMSIGRLGSRQDQIESLGRLLKQREKLSLEIVELEEKINILASEVKSSTKDKDFEMASQVFTDAMNKYLSALNTPENDQRWPFSGEVAFELRKKGYDLRVEGKTWTSKLGGTLKLYFYLAYHYALMSAMSDNGRNYPGLLMLDFPPDRLSAWIDIERMSDHETYVLESFTNLCEEKPNLQVIATGHSYQGLQGNRIQLETVWK